ncbi:MAG: rhodanese-like domain-containing protein [Acidimicrobiales bacterium]
MIKGIGRDEVQRLVAGGAQLVEVLERKQYEAAHLPGAIHLPAWELTRDRAAAELDPSRPVVVYCFDSL